MFIAELFTLAKTWKQPKRPSTGDTPICRFANVVIHPMEYYSAVKRKAHRYTLHMDEPQLCFAKKPDAEDHMP